MNWITTSHCFAFIVFFKRFFWIFICLFRSGLFSSTLLRSYFKCLFVCLLFFFHSESLIQNILIASISSLLRHPKFSKMHRICWKGNLTSAAFIQTHVLCIDILKKNMPDHKFFHECTYIFSYNKHSKLWSNKYIVRWPS